MKNLALKTSLIVLIMCLLISNCTAEIEEFFAYGEIDRDGEFASIEIITAPTNKTLVVKSIIIVGAPEFTRTYINPTGYVEHFETITFLVGSEFPTPVEATVLFEGSPQRTISYGSISFEHSLMQVYENETLKVTSRQFPYIYSQDSTYYSQTDHCLYYIYGYWTTLFNVADLNRDGLTDFNDLSVFAQNWLCE